MDSVKSQEIDSLNRVLLDIGIQESLERMIAKFKNMKTNTDYRSDLENIIKTDDKLDTYEENKIIKIITRYDD